MNEIREKHSWHPKSLHGSRPPLRGALGSTSADPEIPERFPTAQVVIANRIRRSSPDAAKKRGLDAALIQSRIPAVQKTMDFRCVSRKSARATATGGIKSQSSNGGNTGTATVIRFEDKISSEQLYIHAEKDKDVLVKANRSSTIGDRLEIKNDRTKKTGGVTIVASGGMKTVD